jgi:hypothetical protein
MIAIQGDVVMLILETDVKANLIGKTNFVVELHDTPLNNI